MILFGVDIKNVLFRTLLPFFQKLYLPFRVFFIRRKKVIKVAFVVSDLGKWKTECLYRKMKIHPRFNPVLLIAPYTERDNSGLLVLCDYLRQKGYNYYVLKESQRIADIVKANIIFYQEHYNKDISDKLGYKHNLGSLFCYVSYASHTNDSLWFLNTPLLNFAWQVYFENILTKELACKVMTNKGINCVVTGLPFTDSFLSPMGYEDPWRKQINSKKRIIWAPHHSIKEDDLLHYSTFFKYSRYMLEIADKYKDKIQIAFKPHPLLLTKLYEIWGKEKTDNYYSLWENGENTQLVLGDYVPLFLYSDAMIHDCGSFQVEYHYTKKPVMYLTKDEHHADGLNDFGKMAFDLHYKGRSEKDIEAFINNVIGEKDDMKEVREKFYNDYLLPPDGNSASENIIKAILSK